MVDSDDPTLIPTRSLDHSLLTVTVPSPETTSLPSTPLEYVPPPLIDSTAVGPGFFIDDIDELPQPQAVRDPSLFQTQATKGPTETPQPPSHKLEAGAEHGILESPVDKTSLFANAERFSINGGQLTGVGNDWNQYDYSQHTSYHQLPVTTTSVVASPIKALPSVQSEVDAIPALRSGHSSDSGTPAMEVLTDLLPVQPVTPVGEAAPYFALLGQTGEAITIPQPNGGPAEALWTAGGPSTFREEDPDLSQRWSCGADLTEATVTPPEIPTQLAERPAPASTPMYDVHEEWEGASLTDDEELRFMVPSIDDSASPRYVQGMWALEDPVEPKIMVLQHPELEKHVLVNIGTSTTLTTHASPCDSVQHQSVSEEHSTEYASILPTPLGHDLNTTKSPYLRRNYLQPNPTAGNPVKVRISDNSQIPTPPLWPVQSSARLHNHGWIEYPLLDGTVYYVHPARRVTTDVDLRADSILDVVTAFLEQQKDEHVPQGVELWLREPESSKSKQNLFIPVKCWVDHRKWVLQSDLASEADGNAMIENVETDNYFDVDYRYWAFIQTHPAHAPLPHNAKVQAMNVLVWVQTNRRYSLHRNISYPFTQDECQQLMLLLRSFGHELDDGGLESIIRTRMVSGILLRVAQWRQLHVHPHMPLSCHDHETLGCVLFNLIQSCLYLRIAYAFFHHYKLHLGSGLCHTLMIIVGACIFINIPPLMYGKWHV